VLEKLQWILKLMLMLHEAAASVNLCKDAGTYITIAELACCEVAPDEHASSSRSDGALQGGDLLRDMLPASLRCCRRVAPRVFQHVLTCSFGHAAAGLLLLGIAAGEA
jgi:hypothetical protein